MTVNGRKNMRSCARSPRWGASRAALMLATCVAIGCGPATGSRPVAAPLSDGELPDATKRLQLDRTEATGGEAALPLLGLLEGELERSMRELQKAADPPPYYLAYEVSDVRSVDVRAENGALVQSADTRRRLLDVDVRVGAPTLDNTHPRLETQYFMGAVEIPVDDGPAVTNALWWQTDVAYKQAASELINVRAERNVGVSKDADLPDFTSEQTARFIEAPAKLDVDSSVWEKRIAAYAASLRAHPRVQHSFVRFEATAATRLFASSEGARLQTPRVHVRLSFGVFAIAPDGSALSRTDEIDAHTLARLPDDATIRARLDRVAVDLGALLDAPAAEPFVGPAILDGKAAAVFMHEIFGHRVEGHRQKGELEGQTFVDQMGQPIMSAVFDVVDDPRVRAANGIDLNGFYTHDSEGVPATPALLIDDGVFRGFLMSRSPVRGVEHSNGHGRRQPGYRAVARQANLIVDPSRVTTRAALERALLAEVRKQGKPYGLRVGEVTGGYTMTQRGDPQAFKVEPVMVYRVYADGHEELVRGVSLEGTPLSVLADVVAAGDDFAVFNGYCGAESGEVPASAVSPSLLIRQIEITREETAGERPPLLPDPSAKKGAAQ